MHQIRRGHPVREPTIDWMVDLQQRYWCDKNDDVGKMNPKIFENVKSIVSVEKAKCVLQNKPRSRRAHTVQNMKCDVQRSTRPILATM